MNDPESTVDGSGSGDRPRPAWMLAAETTRKQPVELLLGLPRPEENTADAAAREEAVDAACAEVAEVVDAPEAAEEAAVAEAETLVATGEIPEDDDAEARRVAAYSEAAGRVAAGAPAPAVEEERAPEPEPEPEREPEAEPEAEPDAVEEVEAGPALVEESELEAALESLLLVIDSPGTDEALAEALDQPVARVAAALRRLSARYTEAGSGIDLRRVADGWRFYTRDRFAPYVERLLLDGQRAKLTRAALETLAVIAYRQPVTRARVAAVRGVNVDGVIRTLLARGLIEETGADPDTNGILYRTTELFLERLGLSSLEDLPPLAPLLPEVDTIDDV
ncbi:segregation and condensation protein B [Allokutzneria albata]|uniref:Segregation and condensation protein B n=1 Tax=Allokutzneria albata TaxID=211114 RepID=A0A1G9WMF9_ALLAB|nr:segregation and condensation protein B [Allokutzneria albata]